jgi:ubiquitin
MAACNYDDYIGNEYPLKRGILITIFSQSFPLKHGDDKYFERKKKSMLTIEGGARADVDALFLQAVFKEIYPETSDVILKNSQTKLQVKDYIQQLDKNDKEYDYFFFVFLTYMSCSNIESSSNKDERIHLYDGLCPMQEFYDEVKRVDALAMKPKIFLVQADDINLLDKKKFTKTKGEMVIVKAMKIPQDADRLVLMSDLPQRLANPDLNAGDKDKRPSFLIQAFGKTLLNNSKRSPEQRLDLLALTPIINSKVLKRIDDLRKDGNERAKDMTVPLVSSTLTKLVKI